MMGDKQAILEAIEKLDGEPFRLNMILQGVSDEVLSDRDVILASVKIDGRALQFASTQLKKDPEVVLAAMSNPDFGGSDILMYASEELRYDFEVMRHAVKIDRWALSYASGQLKRNKALVMEAVQSFGASLESASVGLQNDRDIVLQAVKTDGFALAYASEVLRDDYDIVMEAVKDYGLALEHASVELRNNFDLALVAVKSNGNALHCVSEDLKSNKDIVFEAVKNELNALEYVPDDFLPETLQWLLCRDKYKTLFEVSELHILEDSTIYF